MILNIDFKDSISRMMEQKKLLEDINKFRDEFEIFRYNFSNLMSAKEMLGVYKKWKNGDETYIRNYFNQKFEDEKNLHNILEKIGTNKYFSERKDILADALDAHYNKKYTLSIPVMLTQIDGIFTKAYEHMVTEEDKNKCEKCGRSNNIWARLILRILKDKNIDPRFSDKFLISVHKIYRDDRNGILHGGKTRYADQNLSTHLIISLYELYITLEK